MPSPDTSLTKRYLLLFFWIVLSLLLFLKPVITLVRLSLSQDDASHLVLIPLISTVILYLERRKIFLRLSSDKVGGAALFLVAALVALTTHFAKNFPALGLQLSGWILALVLLWTSGFAFLF